MKKLLFAALIIAVIVGFTGNNNQQIHNTTVTEVVDGDTINVVYNGQEDTVRFLGIDTPETHRSNIPGEYNLDNTSQNRACLKRYGKNASQFIEKEIGKEVEIRFDPNSERRGSYGRLLGYVYSNKTSLNRALLERGLARVYVTDFSRKEEYLGFQKEAREKNKGLWSC